jgi:micrococcal nuclease
MAYQSPHKVPWTVLCLLLVPATLAQEPILHARCVGVTDGDTTRVLTADQQQFRIRLAWIDAPERGQAFGSKAKQAMSELVFGKEVELRVYGLDKYGRTLATVFVDGKDVCLEEVR